VDPNTDDAAMGMVRAEWQERLRVAQLRAEALLASR
jgi:hypothetical protein